MAAKIGFHELPGVTISEKTKAFRIYLREVEAEFGNDRSKVDFIINSITPDTYLETLFKVKMVLYFRRFDQLIEIIKSENKALIGKIIKDKWFFNEIINNFTPEQLVNDIFTHTSYSTRMKILNKLSKCTVSNQYANQLFETYRKKYGIHSAKQLLLLLSSENIKEIILSNGLNMSTSMLKQLIDKDPNLDVILWEKYKNVITPFLAKRDVLTLWKYVENELNVRLGRKATNKVIQKYKEYVLKHPEKCLKYLKLREVVKRLSNNYNEMLCNWFTNEFYIDSDNMYSKIRGGSLLDYLKHLDKQRQLALFTDVYTQVFKKAPCEDIEKINYPLALNFIIDISKRDAIAEMKYTENKETIKWISYMTIDKSIPLIKERIKFSSDIYVRGCLLNELVKTCEINNDLTALLEVEKYVLQRHRNDLFYVRENFMSSLYESFKIEELNSEHWKNILELLVLFELDKEKLGMRRTILQKHLLHCWLHSLPMKQHLVSFLTEYGISGIDACLNGSSEFKKALLELTREILPDVFPKKKDLAEAYKVLFNATKQFNDNNSKKLRIPLQNLEQSLSDSVQILIDNNVNLTDMFWYFIYNKESDFRAHILDKFWMQSAFEDRNLQIIVWLLLNESENVLRNFDTYSAPEFCKYLIKNRNVLYVTKMYQGMTERLIKKALLVFKSDVYDCEQRANAIKTLSFLVDEISYCDLACEFYPTESHLNLNLDDSSTAYSIQTAVCDGFKNLCVPSLAIPSILQFCTGDHLKIVLSSLYSTFYHVPEKKLYAVVEKLLDRPLSVRKHALFLNSAVMDAAFVFKTLEAFTKKEESPFVQCHLFTVSFKYFCKYPDDKFWNLMKSFIINLDSRDVKTFKVLVTEKAIPKKYLAKYIELAWKVLEEKEPDIEKFKYNLLFKVSEDMVQSLSSEFCEKIISENLKEENSHVRSFTFKYLYCRNTADGFDYKLNLVFKTLKNIRASYVETNKAKYLNIIHNITKKFANFALQNENIEYFTAFKEHWEELIKIEDDLRGYIKLSILFLHLTTPAEHYIEVFGQKFADFLFEFENNFGAIVFISFEYPIQRLIQRLLKIRLEKRFHRISIEFCKTVLASGRCVSTAVFVLKTMIENFSTIRYEKMDVSKVIELLEDRPEPIIKMLLNDYLRTVSLE